AIEKYARRYRRKVHIPKFSYTTDNAAMVAIAGYFKYLDNDFCGPDVAPYARVAI
ncbi:MAG: tRNA (adenosine(37)-N6)-threonylcarbamoyltransferase complex transferase subunit TsaD, partial [Dysgonamonadaceae bacterium]|nr:tRNA (adenosine(37)-N6)-threonylcarbamoyltransferase complex transferase subunit TsaD [Dysgonamonadaceae bacterium]